MGRKFSKTEIDFKDLKKVIDVYFNLDCDLNCSYCYSPHKDVYMTKENVDIFLQELGKHPEPIVLKILGGEPSIFEHIEYFINNLPKQHHIIFTTNGQQTHTLEMKHPNLTLAISGHYEYFKNSLYLENIIKTLKKFENIKKNILINLPLHLSKKENFRILEYLENIYKNNFNNVCYTLNGIILDDDLYTPYNVREYYDKLKEIIPEEYFCNNQKGFIINNKESTVKEVFDLNSLKNENNGFKNKCMCFMSEFHLSPDLTLSTRCFEDILCSKENFNIPIDAIKGICPRTECDLHCYVQIKKIFF